MSVVFNNTKTSFNRLIYPTLFLEDYTFDKNAIYNYKLDKIKFSFVLSDISNLDDTRITSFLLYISLFLQTQKKPYFKKVFVSKRRIYKIIIIFTFRRDELYSLYEKIIFTLNSIAPIDRKSTFSLLFEKKSQVLKINVKKLKFFEVTTDTYSFPKVFSEIQIYFSNFKIRSKNDLEFLLLLKNSTDIIITE
jgi:hypothetical protein